MTMKYPVNISNDIDMYYDVKKHRYILTPDAVSNNLGINLVTKLNNSNNVKVFLEQVSQQIYNYIYKNLDLNSKRVLEYRIASDVNDEREGIKEMMLQFVKFSRNGGSLIDYQHGINFENGMLIDNIALDKASVPPVVKKTALRYNFHIRNYSYIVNKDDYRVGY